MHILYVEDNPLDADLTCQAMSKARPGFRLDVVGNLADALNQLAQSAKPQYDLVLCDQNLPDGDGLALLTQIRRQNLPLAVVIITGSGDEELVMASLKAGADDYIVKRDDYLARLPATLEATLSNYRLKSSRLAQPLRTLYAEDNPVASEATQRHLTQYAPHIQLKIVRTAGQALQRLPEQGPVTDFDLLLLNFRLPGLNALELLKEIRQTRQLDLPIVLVAAQGDEALAMQALKLGIDDYVVKHSGYLYQLPLVLENAFYSSQLSRERVALTESEAKNSALLNAMPDLMLRVHQNGICLDYKPAQGAELHLPSGQIIGFKIQNLFPPAVGEQFMQAVGQALSTQQTQLFEFQLSMPDGLHYYEARVVVSGEWDILAIIRDISKEKQALEALSEREAYFRALIENISDVITVLNMDGTVRFQSSSIERVLGYKVDDMVGRNAFDFMHPDDASDVVERIVERTNIPGLAPPIEVRFKHQNGSWRIFEVMGNNMLADPTVSGIVVISRDITERKALEEQLRQSQKMEAIGRLAGGIAHDFNNILTVITGYSDLMMRQLEPDSHFYQKMLEINMASERAASLTGQLLAFSRKQVLQLSVLNLNDVLINLEQMLRRLIGEDITLEIIATSNLDLMKADRGQVEQVIINLAVNARDSMPGGGKLTIKTDNEIIEDNARHRGNAWHRELAAGSYVVLSVSDTGHGMDDLTLSRIYEPFFTTKEQGRGTGLGLATVHGIVTQSGGHIIAESTPDLGTIFKVYFPVIAPESKEGLVEQPASEHETGSETILLVEDEPGVRELIGNLLVENGYTVLTADHGEAAIDVSQRYYQSIDLLLTDVIMPGGMTGLQLAEKLRRQRPNMRILYMSGYMDNAISLQAMKNPSLSFLQKPFALDVLAHKVRQVLDQDVR